MSATGLTSAGVEWRPIPSYEGMYEVSSAGQVRSLARNQLMPTGGIRRLPQRVMVATPGAGGYPRVTLSRAGRRTCPPVHQLVARAFLAASHFGGAVVCHADGNPLNNNVQNLRWGTTSDNMRDCLAHGTHAEARRTHCDSGHRYTEANTAIRVRNGREHRVCRACHRDRCRTHRERKGVAA